MAAADLFKNVDPNEAQKALNYLRQFGYIHSDEPNQKEVEQATAEFQYMFGLEVDGEISAKELSTMALPRCSVPDCMVMEASLPAWDLSILPITWFVRDRDNDLTAAQWDTNIANALVAIAEVCSLTFQRVDREDEANIILYTGTEDGAGNTIAWCQLPGSGRYKGQSKLMFDRAERFVNSPNQQGIWHYPICLHELLHGMGLSHTNVQGSIMQPTYSPALYTVDSWSKNELTTRYGKRTGPVPSPKPIPLPQPSPTVETTIKISGNIQGIEIPGWRVSKIA